MPSDIPFHPKIEGDNVGSLDFVGPRELNPLAFSRVVPEVMQATIPVGPLGRNHLPNQIPTDQ